MSPLDALFLHAEDGVSHMHIGSCAIYDGDPPTMDEIRALVESKLHLVPRFRQKVRFVPGGLGRPVWVDAARVDLGFHLRRTALPAPGDEAQLHRLVGRLMSQELDRRRPLWEMWVVEGLDPAAHGGSWAVVSKVHHCMVDGISGTDLMTAIMDRQPDAAPSPPPPWSPRPEPSDLELTVGALAELSRAQAKTMVDVARSVTDPRRAAGHVVDIARGMHAFGREVLTQRRRLSVEGAIGPQRRYAVGRSRLADIKVVRSAFGGSVNDVVLSAITAGFRGLLQHRGEDVDDAVISSLVPVSVRTPGDTTHNNQVSMMIADLPVGIADPVERLHRLCTHLAELKASHEADAGALAFEAAELLPPVMFSLGARAVMTVLQRTPQYTVNTVTTNVPGPPFPLYLCSRRMIEYAPYVPLTAGLRIGVAILSYDGNICFGLTGDYDSAPDLPVMARAIEDAIAELVTLARERGGR